MASKTISTRLVIEGESEYRQSVSNINSSLGVLKSELSKVKAEYSSNANGMEALRAKQEAYSAIQQEQAEKVKLLSAALENAKTVQRQYGDAVEASRTKLAQAEAALEKMRASDQSTAQEQEKLTQAVEEYRAELAQSEKYNEAAQKSVNKWETQLNNAERDVYKLSAEVKKNDTYMSEAKKSADGCATSIDKFGKKTKAAEQEAQSTATAISALASALMAAGVTMGLQKTVEAIGACVDASVEFESAMTGVFKTVDGTDAQLAGLTEGIRAMALEIPSTTTEIAGVAEAAGQLGIKTDDILAFTRVMIDLGNSTNLSAGEAASALAKFANITGMSADEYQRLGSVIVDLGNHFATTEADIVAMGTRLSATGNLVGLNEAQIMAVATALSSLGIDAEAGGTAISKLLKQFEVMVATGSADLDAFAKVAGMSAAEFSEAWKKEPIAALSAFIDGLGAVDAAGGSSVATLEGLGITEVRMSNAVLAMASSQGILQRAVETANTAWSENTALTDEAGKRYETTESKIALMKNAATELKTAVGDQLNPAISGAATAGKDLLEWATELVRTSPELVSLIAAVVGGLGGLVVAVTGYNVVTQLAAIVTNTFNTALKSNPIGLVAMALTILIGALGTMAVTMGTATDATSEAIEKADALTKSLNETKAAYEETSAKIGEQKDDTLAMAAALEELAGTENKSVMQKAAMKNMVDRLNETVPNLNLAYDEQTDSLNMTAEAVKAVARAMAEQAQVQADIENLSKAYTAQWGIVDKLRDAQEALNDAKEEAARIWGDDSQLIANDANVQAAQRSVDELTRSQKENNATIDELSKKYPNATGAIGDFSNAADVLAESTVSLNAEMQAVNDTLTALKPSYDLLSKAQQETAESGQISADTLSSLLSKYPELSGYLEQTSNGYVLTKGALDDYVTAQRTSYQLAYDKAASAASAIVDSEALKAAGFDATTTSIRAQIEAMAQLYMTKATEARSDFYDKNGNDAISRDMAKNDATIKKYEGLASTANQAVLQLDAAQKKLDTFDATTATLKGSTSSGSKKKSGGSGGKSGEKVNTPLEDLQGWLDDQEHQIFLWSRDGAKSDAIIGLYGEMQKKAHALAEGYRASGYADTSDEIQELQTLWWGYADDITKAKKDAYDKDLGALKSYLDDTDRQIAALAEQPDTGEARIALIKEEQEREHAMADAYRAKGYADTSEEIQTLKGLWADGAQEILDVKSAMYDEDMADLDYLHDMGIVSDSEYYDQLGALRDEYLTEGSEEWRSVTVSIHNFMEKRRQEELAAAKKALEEQTAALKDALDGALTVRKNDYSEQTALAKDAYDAEKQAAKDAYDGVKEAAKEAYDAEKDAAKDAYEARKRQIADTLAAERERLDAVIDGIDREVEARKRLREDEDQDDAVARAQKRLDVAKAELTYARTDEDRAQWSKEIVRLQEALDAAVRDREDTAFYRRKDEEKAQAQAQIDAAEDAAKKAEDAAKTEYDEALKRMEARYDQDVKDMEAAHDAALERIEAGRDAELRRMEAEYDASVDRLQTEYDRTVARLKADYERERTSGGYGGGSPDGYGGAYGGGTAPYGQARQAAASAAQMMGRAVESVTRVMTGAVSNTVTHNATANVAIHQASGLTSGQIAAAVEQTINKLSR